MTVMAGVVPTRQNGPLPLGSLGRGGLSLIHQPLPENLSNLPGGMTLLNQPLPESQYSMRSSNTARGESKRLEFGGVGWYNQKRLCDLKRHKPDAKHTLSVIENSKSNRDFITGLHKASPRQSKSKGDAGQLPLLDASRPAKLSAYPPQPEAGKELPGDEEPRATLSSRQLNSSHGNRRKETEIERRKRREAEIVELELKRRRNRELGTEQKSQMRNGPDYEEGSRSGSKEVSTASAIAEMTRPRAIWDALNWLELRQQSLDSCNNEDVCSLMHAAQKSTQNALESRSYVSETGLRIPMKAQVPVAQWFGVENLKPPAEVEGCIATSPIIVAELEPLDVVRRLKNAAMSHQINVLTDITEFDRRTGDISKQCIASSTQHSCLLQTDFSLFMSAASHQMGHFESTMEEHLRACDDPYVCLCPEVTLFRGTRDDGYPLLDEPLSMNVIFSSLPEARPLVQVSPDGSQWYADEKNQAALLERLTLIGMVALQKNAKDMALQKKAIDSETLPILVLNAFGCGGRGQHPRDAVAYSLKHWRTGFGRYFHSVIVACGSDRDLALHMDSVINEQVYCTLDACLNEKDILWNVVKGALLQQEMVDLCNWHWDADVLALHCRNLELQSAGDKAKDWHQSFLAKQKAEQEAREMEEKARKAEEKASKHNSLNIPGERPGDVPTEMESFELPSELGCSAESGLDDSGDGRFSLKLNGCFFNIAALTDTLSQMVQSRCHSPDVTFADSCAPSCAGSRSGSRAGSRKGSLAGAPEEADYRERTASLSNMRLRRLSSKTDALEDPDLRRKSWGGDSPGGSRRPSLQNDSSRLSVSAKSEASRRKSSLLLPQAPARKSSCAGVDISEVSMPMNDGPAESSNRKASKLQSSSKDTEELTQEDIRRQARDKLRARKGNKSAQEDVQDDAKSCSTAAQDDILVVKDESSLLQEVQGLAGNVSHRLEKKRTDYEWRRSSLIQKVGKGGSKDFAKLDGVLKVEPAPENIVESNDSGSKRISLQIPGVPVMDGMLMDPSHSQKAGVTGKRRSSYRHLVVAGDVTCGNLGVGAGA